MFSSKGSIALCTLAVFCLLSFSSSQTTCRSDQFLNTTNVCVDCFMMWNTGCISCNRTTCLTCKEGNYMISGYCKPCFPGCKTCNDSTSCTECQPRFFLQDSSTCANCSQKCATCNDSTTCLTCHAFNADVLYNGSCVQGCPSGFWPNTTVPDNKTCAACNSTCASCKGPSANDCTSCPTGANETYLFNGACVQACPPGQSPMNGKCILCSENCASCSSGDNCTACNTGFFNHKGRCLPACPPGFINDVNNTCVPCADSCLTCKDNSSFCTQCISPKNLIKANGSCLDTCPDGSFTQNGVCVRCAPGCDACGNYTQCTTCSTGFNLTNGMCTSSCPTGTYPNGTACAACASGCATCVDGSKCVTCTNGSLVDDGTCVAACPTGTFSNDNKRCEPCAFGCGTCTNKYNCTICSSNFFSLSPACLERCPPGYYPDTATKKCVTCPANCTNCLGAQNCIGCQNSTAVINNGSCVATCPNGTYSRNSSMGTNQICTKCMDGCDVCGFAGMCIKCTSPNVLLKDMCLPQCPPGFFNASGICNLCTPGCAVCANNTGCSKCFGGFDQFNGTCQQQCFENQVPANGSCISCASSCKGCFGVPNNCTACQNPDNSLLNGTCVLTCPPKYFRNPFARCEACSQNCEYCESPFCDKCASPFVNDRGNCVSVCLNGSVNYLGRCLSCPLGCSNCTVSTTGVLTCAVCESGWTLASGACSPSCAAGQFYNKTTNSCAACDPSCATCNRNNLSCTSCPNSTYLLLGNICITACPNGFYANDVDQTCNNCSRGCETCTSKTDCSACANGGFLLNNSCYGYCPPGYFGNATKDCVPCTSPCKTCDTAADTCKSCDQPSLYLHQGQCIDTCPAGFYNASGLCNKCSEGCNTCKTDSFCEACDTGLKFFEGRCYSMCPPRTFAGNSTTSTLEMCIPCDKGCEMCSGFKSCDKCEPGYFPKEDGTCQPYCQPNQLLTTAGCVTCSSTCKSCSRVATNCTSCADPNSALFTMNGTCLAACPQGFYKNASNGICVPCTPNCNSCSGPICNTCNTNFSLTPKGECVQNCGAGFYSSTGKCNPCSFSCLQCTNATVCTQCSSGYSLTSGACTTNCSAGTFPVLGLSSTGQTAVNCQQCDSSCLTCKDQPSNCLSCNGTYLLQDSQSKCITTCPPGTFPNVTNLSSTNPGSCNKCVDPCLECTSNTNTSCVNCKIGFFLHKQSCMKECPPGTFKNYGDFTCAPCHASCAACERPDECTACGPDLVLSPEKQCAIQCDPGFYSFQGTCTRCSPSCLKCTSGTNCNACDDSTLLENGKCVAQCSFGTYPGPSLSGRACLRCGEGCLSCDSPMNCYACATGYNSVNGTCSAICAKNQFVNSTGGCVNCSTTCGSCSRSATNCIACANNTFLNIVNDVGQCVTACPNGTFVENGKCVPCPGGCNSCFNSTNCSTCAQGLFLATNKDSASCVNSCPVGTFVNGSKCMGCSSGCVQCLSATSCQTCAPGFNLTSVGNCSSACANGEYFDPSTAACAACATGCTSCDIRGCLLCSSSLLLTSDRQCVQNCPDKTLAVNGTCKPCPENCVTCNTTNCLTCSSGYDLNGGKCVMNCSAGYFFSSGTCLPCDSTCGTCNNSVSCTSCLPSSTTPFLYYGKCVPKCPERSFINNTLCINCSTNCASCAGSAQNCTSCNTAAPFLTPTGTCVTNCTAGTFANGTFCQNCARGCSSCTAQGCTQCRLGFTLNGTICNTDCLPRTYPNTISTSPLCLPCPGDCQTCTNGSTCTVCDPGFSLTSTGSCIASCANCDICDSTTSTCSKCKAGYFLKRGGCGPCFTDCLECEAAENTTCKRWYNTTNGTTTSCDTVSNCRFCSPDGTCSFCNDGFFNDNGTCTACNSDCRVCNNSDTCMQCNLGFSNHNGSCVNVSNSYCGANCGACDQVNATAGRCIQPAPYTYFNGSGVANCVSGCINCNNGSDCMAWNYTGLSAPLPCGVVFPQCRGCASLMGCSNCSAGFYVNGKSCSPCGDGCEKCFNSTICQACRPGYFNANQSCYACSTGCARCSISNITTTPSTANSRCAACLPGFYLEPTNFTCTACADTNCSKCNPWGCEIWKNSTSGGTDLVCNSSTPNCLTCANNGTCNNCTKGYLLNSSTGACDACPNNCSVCSSTTNCTTCNPGFISTPNSLCINASLCGPGCNVCDNSTSPPSCAADACAPGFFFALGKCNPCAKGCLSCASGDLGACMKWNSTSSSAGLSCNSSVANCQFCNFTNTTNTVQCLKCQDGYGGNATNCSACPSNCKDCKNGVCTMCLEDFVLNSTNDCITSVCGSDCAFCNRDTGKCERCKPRRFWNSTGEVCQNCTAPCVYCESDSTETCAAVEILVNNTNVTKFCSDEFGCKYCNTSDGACLTCASGFVKNDSICIRCPDGCATCALNGTARECSQCATGFIMNATTSICSVNTTSNITCGNECADCNTTSGFCKRCKDGLFANWEGQCLPCAPNCSRMHQLQHDWTVSQMYQRSLRHSSRLQTLLCWL
eukprot:TRINITY_DN251_c0_g5_i1.p1 TRINITY_DN251_c0_g5~~TRINITY_DN251_c0_g5_i1.p1  ORF type:complete len:2505 (+),score=375.87 TRINITY_DN251_c0_g5_i1:195-7709(+)